MDKIISFIFLSLLIFSPLAFGTVEIWSYAVMEIAAVFALLLLTIRNTRQKDNPLYQIPGIIPLCFILLYVLFQLVPLPPEILKALSPGAYRIYQDTIFTAGIDGWVSISINKKATLLELLRIASYVAFYILTVQLLTDRKFLMKTVSAVIIFASLLSCFSILQHLLSNNRIYWFRELTSGGSLFGPYVNRNHYAGLMEMLFPIIMSLFLLYKPHVRYKSFRDRMAALFNLKRTNIYMLLGFGAILAATSIFLTLSRMGIVSLCVSMIVFGLMFMLRGGDRKRGIIIAVVGILVVLSVGWFGWDPIFERFEKLMGVKYNIEETRVQIWSDSSNIMKDFPLTGTGMGTFINIYPRYRTVPGNATAAHAHNDYIELFTDGGTIAYALLLWFAAVFFYKVIKAFIRRRDTYSIYMFIAAISGIVSIIIHSSVDFNLHTGANGLYFSFLLGFAVSTANTRMHQNLNNTLLDRMKLPAGVSAAFAILLFTGVFIINAGVFIGDRFFAEIRTSKISADVPVQEIQDIRKIAYKASVFDPLEADYRYAVANAGWLLSDRETSKKAYSDTLRLNPVNGEYLQRTGLVMSESGKRDVAEKLLEAGMVYDVQNSLRYRRYAAWLFSMDKRAEAKGIIRKAIVLEPEKTREYITLMILNKLNDMDILAVLPDMAEPHFIFADYLLKTGNEETARDVYLNAFEFIKKGSKFSKAPVYSIRNYYVKKSRFEEAVAFMKKVEGFSPEDPQIKISIGDIYERLVKKEAASEEYKKALSIDPNNLDAKKRLERVSAKSK